ncbi:MAG: N-acetyltransferase family protein, partial [Nocardioides sp.]
MELRQIDPDDAAAVASYVEITNEVRDLDSPWEHRMTQAEGTGLLRFGWDLEPAIGFLAGDDGAVVGLAEYSTSQWDNHHLAWLWVSVRPSERRRGHGSALVELMADRARAEGRSTVGVGGWDNEAGRAFAKRHGFELKSQEVCRRQYLADLDRDALAARQREALQHATAYELVRRLGRTPDDELAALAAVTEAINDAPTDDLDVEDEVFSAERVRDYETAQLGQGQRLHRVFARHRESGELAGHTVVAVSGERPENAEQHDTSVVRAHRGHRLGLLLKTDMLDWLAETQPQVTSVETWNAESNDAMIGVNEILGYRVMGRALQFQ